MEICGLNEDELMIRAEAFYQEADAKLKSWRRNAVRGLLEDLRGIGYSAGTSDEAPCPRNLRDAISTAQTKARNGHRLEEVRQRLWYASYLN
jgi:hypothetical protein